MFFVSLRIQIENIFFGGEGGGGVGEGGAGVSDFFLL